MEKTMIPSNSMEGILMSEKEVTEVLSNSPAYEQYLELTEELQEEVRNFIRGKRGLKVTYDPFFKQIFNPVIHGDRLSRLLTCLLGQEVKVKEVLPTESKRLSSESSLLIMDIIVELENGSLADLEIQKIGYNFPGQRSACYSSDLVIRQYDRLKRKEKLEKKKFFYRDLKSVYTIVILEKSTREFHRVPHEFIHRSSQHFETGLELDLLQEYIFVALDIFPQIAQNIDTELEAWLYFLSSDDPMIIGRIIEAYPAFRGIYREIAEFQRKPEELIRMYNETLALFDKYTVEYMIEEQQEEIRKLTEEAKEMDQQLKKKDEEAKENSEKMNQQLKKKDEELELLRNQLAAMNKK